MEVKSLEPARLEPSAEALDLQARARRFVEEIVIPLEEEAEALGGKLPDEKIAAVKRAAVEAGLDGGMHAVEHGGQGWTRTEWCLVEEQFGRTTNAIHWYVPQAYNIRAVALEAVGDDDAEIGDEVRHAADVLRDQFALGVDQRGAEIAHLVDHHVVRRALQVGRHLAGDGGQGVADDFERDGVEWLAAGRLPLFARADFRALRDACLRALAITRLPRR